ncbi:aspartate/glutamate racemase family protein [Variovorax sp. V116]|uniref:aspartate/glutamate racemase family protein n=1 Tax=Variovorax sp. V116 TaxID=3065953 RepID=UPI0034E8ACD2
MNAAAPGFLGVLMLDTRFPRPPGDVGNAQTYARAGIPVRFLTVQGASPRRIVEEADPRLVQPFVDAAVRLAAEGASMITTSCGFLAAYQDVLSQAVPVPVLTSSLLQVRHCAGPGIVTFDAQSLTPQILQAAGVPAGTPVMGVRPGCEFHRRILDNDTVLDLAEAQRNVVEAAVRLVQAFPSVERIVLECTNMPPYREAVAAAVGREVHDIETMILEAWRAQTPA